MGKSIFYKHRKLYDYFIKADYNKEKVKKIHKNIILYSFIISIIVLIFFISTFLEDASIKVIFAITLILLFFGTAIISFLSLIFFYSYIDLKIFWRKKEAEKVLPEFLILTSSNMRAGMLIDQALMYSLRPKFGILAKEMESVLKEVMSGKNLTDALREFTKKYDSDLLKRPFDIIIEGIETGGKTASILNKIGVSLSELDLQKKEMSSSVTTYVIFISFASIVAAPVLMALAGTLLEVIKTLMLTLSQTNMNSGPMNFMNFSVPELTQNEFIIFSIVMLTISSIFSAMIISTIRKGDIKQGLKYIPIYILTSIGIFFLAYLIIKSLFGGMFAL